MHRFVGCTMANVILRRLCDNVAAVAAYRLQLENSDLHVVVYYSITAISPRISTRC